GDWSAPALWRLLFRVLSPLSTDASSASLALETQACWVKSALCSQGYPRLALAQLPEDGSRGSRELLLALSWLLARGPLPEKLLAQAHVQVGDEMPVCECEALASPGPGAPHVQAEDPVDIRCVQWLMGRLRFRWRCLAASQQEQCTLLSKLLWRLQHENTGLEAALEWRRGELVFWRWMDTVLTACPLEAPAAAAQPTFLPRIPEYGVGKLEPIAQELRALQEELCEAAEHRRVAWEAKVGRQVQGPRWSAARQALQTAVGQELAALQWAWERDRGPAEPHGPHRLVRCEEDAPRGQHVRAAEVIQALRSQEACLEAALCRLQGQCRQELAKLVGSLPGLIWIPPSGH
uniref:Tubulin epsilon and delta complex protein 1 domain-containing protein n=1 Tax=Otolemur garnettii TaxID=30611 RepID=H0X8W0_OTOGA